MTGSNVLYKFLQMVNMMYERYYSRHFVARLIIQPLVNCHRASAENCQQN